MAAVLACVKDHLHAILEAAVDRGPSCLAISVAYLQCKDGDKLVFDTAHALSWQYLTRLAGDGRQEARTLLSVAADADKQPDHLFVLVCVTNEDGNTRSVRVVLKRVRQKLQGLPKLCAFKPGTDPAVIKDNVQRVSMALVGFCETLKPDFADHAYVIDACGTTPTILTMTVVNASDGETKDDVTAKAQKLRTAYTWRYSDQLRDSVYTKKKSKPNRGKVRAALMQLPDLITTALPSPPFPGAELDANLVCCITRDPEENDADGDAIMGYAAMSIGTPTEKFLKKNPQ